MTSGGIIGKVRDIKEVESGRGEGDAGHRRERHRHAWWSSASRIVRIGGARRRPERAAA